MEQEDTIQARMDKVCQSTLEICQVLEDKSRQFDLPSWGEVEAKTLTTYREKLAAKAYNVAVVGEASYGKSSWINALLGLEVLPTAVPISTSKVFRVSKASYKAYRLRFEDNSTKDITPDELHTYGSHSDRELANAHNITVDLSKLRWIEVEYPAEFLPAGISLLDTPGLGTVNLAHEALTRQIIRDYADAVIFVLDSTKEPLSEPGVNFLQDILEVTPHIFFLQTKIDAKRGTYDSEHGHPWQEMRQRNQESLHIILKKNEKVWPISSYYLRDATRNSSKRNAYLKKSHFQELKPALELFLFKAAGWQYCTKLLKIVSQYHETSWKRLVIRLKSLEALTSQELIQMQQKKLQEIQKFEDEWGTHGEKRRGLLSDARKIVNSAKNEITEWVRLNGEIETAQRAKITALKTFKDAEKFVKNPENQVAGKIIDHWYSLTNDAQDKCSKLLGKLEQEADSLLTLPEIHPSVSVPNPITLHYDWGASAKGAIDSLTHSFTYWYLASAMLHITFPLSIVGSIGSMTAATLANANEQLQKAQQDLYTQLQSTMEEIRKGFLDPNLLLYDGQNLVKYYFDTFFSSLELLTEKIVSERVQMLRQESARLEKDIELDEHKRSAKIRVYQQQLDVWEVHGQLIKDIDIELLSLTAALETADQL